MNRSSTRPTIPRSELGSFASCGAGGTRAKLGALARRGGTGALRKHRGLQGLEAGPLGGRRFDEGRLHNGACDGRAKFLIGN